MSATLGRPRTRPDTIQTNERRTRDLTRYYETDPMIGWAKSALANARKRAKRKHLACTITLQDVLDIAETTTHCPISGVPLYYGRGHGAPREDSASVDRTCNSSNYEPNSIAIVSNRINRVKNNATIEELIALGQYAVDNMGK